MKHFILILFFVMGMSFFIPHFVVAEKQIPGSILLIETDPYYFSEGDFGLKFLNFFQRPLSPYLIPGKTTEQSTIQEISDAYNEVKLSVGQKAIVDDNTRAMTYVVGFSGGDLQKTYRFDTFQKFTHIAKDQSNSPYYYQNVQYGLEIESLPSEDKKSFYDDLVIPSINPGKAPEPIDMRFDTVTGDGTILFSTVYDKCTVKDASMYLSDNMVLIRYTQNLKSEIHGNSLIDCVGTNFKVSPQSDSKFDYGGGNLKKVSPIIQTSIGIPAEDTSCKEGSTLMIRPPNNVPMCMKNDSVSQFEERGWKIPSQKEKRHLVDILRPILPSDSERALSFIVSFEGTDISPSQTVETFSKFVPISDENSIIQTPSNPLDSSEKAFYLESLPSKDKNWFYELASRYVNVGAEPESFNVTVHVKDGKGNVLQNWNYRECEITEFTTYYDDNLLLYKFHGKWQSEIKDQSIFRCAGLSIN